MSKVIRDLDPLGCFFGMTRAEQKLSANLALAARVLSHDGHDDFNQGQVSARMPGADHMLIKGALVGFSEATPDSMVSVSCDPEANPHPMAPPELPLHQAIYESRPDVGAIVHSHAPHSLVFGATDLELKPVSHDGAYFADRIPRFTLTSNTVLSIEVGRQIASVLGSSPGAFLRNHGLLVVGRTVREVTVASCLLERATKLQLLAHGSGSSYSSASDEDVSKKKEFIYSPTAIKSYWDYCVRTLRSRDPEVATW